MDAKTSSGLNYRRAPYYSNYIPIFEEVYAREWALISELNVHLLESPKSALGLHEKPTVLSSDLASKEEPTDRLIDICKALGADTCLAGQGGADYMDLERFEKNDLKLIIQDFRLSVSYIRDNQIDLKQSKRIEKYIFSGTYDWLFCRNHRAAV